MRERTGLVLDPYFSATKIEWLLRDVDGLAERARDGRAVFGTIDSWLIFKLTREHVTDPRTPRGRCSSTCGPATGTTSCASCSASPERALPDVRPSMGTLGAPPAARSGTRVPVAGIAGDQQAALFGQACLDPGMAKNTYGTGSFVLLNTGDAPPAARPGCSRPSPGASAQRRFYALEAAIFVTGAAVQWLRDGLGIIERRRARRRRSPRRSTATTASTSCPR